MAKHYRINVGSDETMQTLDVAQATRWVADLLMAGELPAAAAQLVAESLVDAEARGIASHGVARVPIYVKRLRAGIMSAAANPVIVRTTPATAHINANNAIGHLGAQAAVEAASERAAQAGAGVALVRNSNHCGTLGYFARQIAARGQIAVLASNGPPVMIYFGGRTRAVGTNPLAIAIPRTGGRPISLDMATSTTARGRIIHAAQTGADIPEGWAVDRDGLPTTDPGTALDGAVLPFGGPKGSGLAMMIDLLCGGLAAAVTGEAIGDMYEDWQREQRVSHFVMALDPGAWVGGDAFRDHAAAFAVSVGQLPTASGHERVLLPGEIEEHAQARALRDGLTVSGHVFKELTDLSVATNVPVPAPLRNENRETI